MIHDPDLLEALSAFPSKPFSGTAYRATRKSLDPTAPSTNGGRWGPRGITSILYTSLTKEAALAEITFYWSQLDPPPSKSVMLNELKVDVEKILHLPQTDFPKLGLDKVTYNLQRFERCQEIGAAASFLGFDGLISPSARWNGDNLTIFCDNTKLDAVELLNSEEVDWQHWAREQNLPK